MGARFLIVPVLMAGVVASALAAPETYVIDPAHTIPMFEVTHLGMSQQRGFFTNAAGKVVLDRAARSGSIDITIGTGSVVTASRVMSDVLKRDYFNAEQFPVMTFNSRSIVFDGELPVGANGELTLLGVTRAVAIKITGFRCGTHPIFRRAICGADASTMIRRSEFGMKTGLPDAVGDEVKIIIPVEAIKE
jgi:polyisoprenoid-binding protein YceI